MSRFKLYLLFSIPLVAAGCFKDDTPVEPYIGTVTTIKNHIEKYQSYYDFETNSVASYNTRDSWSLGFACGDNEFTICTNSGNNWFILNTGQININASINYPKKSIWSYDDQSLFPDSTAVKDWIAISANDTNYTNNVYLLGKYSGTAYSSIYRIKFLKVTREEYVIYYQTDTIESTGKTVIIQKNPIKTFIYYSFSEDAIKDIEPEKSTWDIVFGSYYDLVTELGVTAPYLVRGVLINQNGTVACIDSTESFESINAEKISTLNLSDKRNTIGYNWKSVTINETSNTATYTINLLYNYIIQTQEGNYFKMRFLSYTLDGENGYPSFVAEKITMP